MRPKRGLRAALTGLVAAVSTPGDEGEWVVGETKLAARHPVRIEARIDITGAWVRDRQTWPPGKRSDRTRCDSI